MISKVTISVLGIFLLLTGVARAQNTAPVADDTVVTLTNGEWPPYTSQHLPHYGFLSRVVSHAFSLKGYYVRYEFYPWKRAYSLAVKGDREGSISWALTPERKKELHFSQTVFKVRKVFFHLRKTPFDWQSISDLARFRLGVTAGYTYGQQFDVAWHRGELQTQPVTNDSQNFGKLLLGRIDAFPLELVVGNTIIRETLAKEQQLRITHHPKPVLVTPIGVAISQQLPEGRAEALLQALNEGLDMLRAQGTYDKFAKDMLY